MRTVIAELCCAGKLNTGTHSESDEFHRCRTVNWHSVNCLAHIDKFSTQAARLQAGIRCKPTIN